MEDPKIPSGPVAFSVDGIGLGTMVLKGVRRGSGLSPIHENVKAGTTERLVLSDLVRTSLSRQEDASLLRVILSGKDGLQNQGTRRKALKEVEVRECWRVAREKEILARAKKFGLVSVENAAEARRPGRLLHASRENLGQRLRSQEPADGIGNAKESAAAVALRRHRQRPSPAQFG